MGKARLYGDQSGIMIVEAAIWFPIVILAYFSFIVTALYLTQKVVLDRAVSRTCLEASAWLSDLHKVDAPSEFSGLVNKFSVNPYRNMIGQVSNKYYPMNSSSFDSKIKENVVKYAGYSLVGEYKGVDSIEVTWTYNTDYIVCGELTVNAKQQLKLPISMAFFDIANTWTMHSTAKSMVFDMDSLVNDLDFVLDSARILSGGSLDIKDLRDFVSDLPSKLDDLFK